ncbi:hypothetical protein WJX72_008172 [[Myrmecia] bisecta]|uniref:Uncharacterized protein n=1 Tax=[Myrmecia] bisecta TaxID=41462 RepID=A0AAW1Q7K9_9CHLO
MVQAQLSLRGKPDVRLHHFSKAYAVAGCEVAWGKRAQQLTRIQQLCIQRRSCQDSWAYCRTFGAEGKESIAEAVGDAKASGKTEAAAHASKAAGDDKVRSKGDDKDIGSKANGDSKQKREGKAERSSKERRPRSDGKRASKEGSRSRSKGCETSKGREASKDRRASKSPGRKRRASRSPSPRRYTRSPPRGVDRRVRPFPGGLRAGSPPPRGIDRRLGPRGFGLGPPLRGWDAPPGLRPLPFDGPGGYRGYPPDEPWGRRPPLGYGRDRSPPPRGAFDPDYDDPRGRPPPGARFADGLGGGGRYPGAFRDGRPGSPPPAGYERWRRWGPYELPPGERSPPQSADFARSRGLESSGDMRRSPGGGREPSRERDKAGVEVSVHTAPESERRRAGETSSVRDSEKVWSAQSGWDKPPVVREVDQKVSRFADNSRGSVSHPDEHASAGTTTDARDRQQADVQEARSESFSHQSQNRGSLRQEERSTHRSPADVRSPQSGSHTGRSNGVRGSPASRTRGREGLHTEGEVQQSISVHLDRSIDPEEKCWYYIDPQGNTQGACSIVQFHTWIAMMRKDASLKVEYEKFKAVTVWREGMAVRVPLMTLLSSQQSPSPPTTPRADELPSPNRLVA